MSMLVGSSRDAATGLLYAEVTTFVWEKCHWVNGAVLLVIRLCSAASHGKRPKLPILFLGCLQFTSHALLPESLDC